MKGHHRWAVVAVLGAVAAVAGIGQTRAQQEPGRRIGERIDDALKGVKDGAKDVGDAVKGQYNRAKGAIREMGISSRVYSRLHWDRDLNGSTIEVEAGDSGATILTGVVPTEAAKRKAGVLAEETFGVKSVVNRLTVGEVETTKGGREARTPTPAPEKP